jgi:virulence-associated protein VapD
MLVERVDGNELTARTDVFPPTGVTRMYAVAFDLDTETLQTQYGTASYKHAYDDIKKRLAEDGFTWTQGSVYFGDPKRVDAVRCVVAVQRLARELPWFQYAVRDIRMLRIEDNNDLMPAISDFKLPGISFGAGLPG